jgi:signal transduction histidine kinase
MIERFTGSLSLRLLAIFLVLGGLFVYGTLSAIRWVYNSDDVRGLISGHLSLHVQYVREDIGSPPRIDRALAITRKVPVDIRISGPGMDWASNPDFPMLGEFEFGPSPAFSDDPDAWVNELQGVEFAYMGNHNFLKMRQGEYDIVVSTPRIEDKSTGPDLTLIIVGLGLSFLLMGYLAVQWLFRPIRDIRAGAEYIGRGRLDHRITKIRRDQLGDLAADINKLAGDVENMLDAKRALLLGISHELRTPLSRMRLGLEFIEDNEDRELLRTEIIEMEKIIVSLVEAERLNERHAQLNRSSVNIGALLETLLNDYFERDRQRIEVRQADGTITADVDEARLSLLLKNLVSNGLRYSDAESGQVTISVDVSESELLIEVSDNGPGIPAAQAEHIGEPFYRADPSRTRDTGGTGLGLYLATLVAKAHGGRLELLNPGEKGARFGIRLPLSS